MISAGATARSAAALAVSAVLLQLTVSANLLTWLGISYVTEGGSLLTKLHPATDLIILASVIIVFQRDGLRELLEKPPLLLLFIGAMFTCVLGSALLTGAGNLVVLLDTFLSAGLLASVLAGAGSAEIARLRRMMQILLAANAVLALAEVAAHATLVPLYLNYAAYHPHDSDFRPTAMFDHPLTGSVMTMFGLALAPRRGSVRVFYTALIWTALLAYGGRMALLASLAILAGLAAERGKTLVLTRDPAASRMVLRAAAGAVVLVVLIGLALTSGVGTRLVGHLYWDDSAQVRLAQWQLLGQLDTWQWLFGTRRTDLLSLLTPLWLGSGVEVIENFWLLMFVSLGVLLFPVFVVGLGALLVWCWRYTTLHGRFLLVGVMLVAATSNSLARKSNVLFCLVATIICMPARTPRVSQPESKTLTRYGGALAA